MDPLTLFWGIVRNAIMILTASWWVWGSVLAFSALSTAPKVYRRWRFSKAGMAEIDRMTGIEFELYLADLFRRLGYQVKHIGGAGDQGADLLLSRAEERVAVQAKRWSKPVDNSAVQQVHSAKSYYDCHKAMVVSNQEFKESAVELARSIQVELWGRSKLATTISEYKAIRGTTAVTRGNHSPAARNAAAKQFTAVPVKQTLIVNSGPAVTRARVCQRCGKAMVLRNGPKGRFWGCSGYPACRYTEDAK